MLVPKSLAEFAARQTASLLAKKGFALFCQIACHRKNFRCRDRRRGLHTAMISNMAPSSTPAARG